MHLALYFFLPIIKINILYLIIHKVLPIAAILDLFQTATSGENSSVKLFCDPLRLLIGQSTSKLETNSTETEHYDGH